ncbi:hypothetical protein BP5796_02936 [Coleophoma crateriformis]|uniref:Heterokaryon incompatibility domain-containing protein n=1 Tax=Coleophoma crateriformis TaxID=565419 RepID=A0A3D8SLU7_9HELO|nr:hypothetical protein BP5796_02936 [Coleophoma crateriformis]
MPQMPTHTPGGSSDQEHKSKFTFLGLRHVYLISARDLVLLGSESNLRASRRLALASRWLEESLSRSYAQLGQMIFGVGQWREPDGSIVFRYYPKRTLDLGEKNVLDAPLLLCSDSPRYGRKYATVSHRWGTLQHLTTTKANLQAHSRSIPFYSLPKTFQDTVIVTRLLGIRHLWIDALCITQDDPDEWRQQSLTMGEIYKNSVCTIAVHTAHSDDQGFLSDIYQGPISVSLQRQYHERVLNVTLRNDFRAQVDRSQLSGRGWVFQERFLSPRTLHFTSTSMFWEDGFGVRSEEDEIPDSELQKAQSSAIPTFSAFSPLPSERSGVGSSNAVPSAYFNLLQKYTTPLRTWANGIKPFNYAAIEDETDGFTEYVNWLQIVERYSRCSLSRSEDKLPAISGMANHIQSRSPNPVNYCAGIWEDQIHAGLLWVSGRNGLRRPGIDRAPSWSWASVDGEVQFPMGAEHLYQSMGVIKIYKQGHAPPGRHTSMTWFDGPGRLVMSTMLREVWIRDNTIFGVPPGLKRSTGYRVMTSNPPERNSRSMIWKYLNPDIGWVSPDSQDFPENLWCASVGSSQFSLDEHLDKVRAVGSVRRWILLLCPTGNSGEFKRCGMGAITAKGWFDDQHDTVITIV